jgi:hypothetical protein
LERRKKKKIEYEKVSLTTRNGIERDLKQQNKKSQDDYLELNIIDPCQAKFVISGEIKGAINTTFKMLAEFVSINNEYVTIKGLEEKNKVIIFTLIFLGKATEADLS